MKIDCNKNKMKRIVPVCIGVMLILTFLSKVMDSFAVAKVSVTNPLRKTLVKQIEGEGRFETERKTTIVPIEGIEIEKINVSIKEVINKETILFTYSLDSLNDLVENKRIELRKKEIDYEIAKINGIEDKEMSNEFLASQEVEKANDNLAKADEKKKEAEQKYRDKLSDLKDDYNTKKGKLESEANKKMDKYAEKMHNEITKLDEEDEDYSAKKKHIETEYNEKIDGVMAELKQAKEKLKNAYKDSKGNITFDEEAYDSEIEAAQTLVDDANLGLENAKINDANNAENKEKDAQVINLTLESMQLDIETIKKEIAKLEQIVQNEGNVYSNVEGIVMGISDSKEIMIGEEKLIFEALIDVDSTKYIKENVEVNINYGANNEALGKVKNIEYKDEETSIVVELVEDIESKMLNTVGNFSINSNCGEYQCCIPVESIKSGANGYFCYIVEETNTVLGKEYVAKAIEVDLEVMNDEYVAVKGDLSETDRVICSYNKTIAEGDRIRIMD